MSVPGRGDKGAVMTTRERRLPDGEVSWGRLLALVRYLVLPLFATVVKRVKTPGYQTEQQPIVQQTR